MAFVSLSQVEKELDWMGCAIKKYIFLYSSSPAIHHTPIPPEFLVDFQSNSIVLDRHQPRVDWLLYRQTTETTDNPVLAFVLFFSFFIRIDGNSDREIPPSPLITLKEWHQHWHTNKLRSINNRLWPRLQTAWGIRHCEGNTIKHFNPIMASIVKVEWIDWVNGDKISQRAIL